MLRRLLHDRGGALIAEIAALIPVIIVLLLGGSEVARYALLNQKLARVSTSMGDLVAQAETLTQSDVNNLMASVPHVAWPFDFQHDGVVIITSVSAPAGTPIVNWQVAGAGGFLATSKIGLPGGAATLPDGMTVAVGDTVIISEVYFNFAPVFFAEVAPATVLYHKAMFRPRLGSLNTLG